MASAIHVPRINNNDDEVKLAGLQIAVGRPIAEGSILDEIR